MLLLGRLPSTHSELANMTQTEIYFSRHAKRRMRLYNIAEEEVQTILRGKKRDEWISDDRNEVIDHGVLNRHGYPIKVVFTLEGDAITVITPQLSESRGCPRFKASKGEAIASYRQPLATQEMGRHRLSRRANKMKLSPLFPYNFHG